MTTDQGGTTGQQADAAAFDQLWQTRRDPMVRLAFVLTGSDSIAEEVVQEAFIAVHDRWENVDNPAAYLRTAVTNGSYGHLRRLRLERALPAPTEAVTDLPDVDETWAVLCSLPFRQRAVLALRFYEDLPEAEIARVLDCRIGTVKSSLHRGLERLRKELA